MNYNSKKINNLYVPISIGELIDKVTILELKEIYLTGDSLNNVKLELSLLREILNSQQIEIDDELLYRLKEVNKNLWNIEDSIRIKEKNAEFDDEFINLARSVYKENDQRALIKRSINLQYNSNLLEEKSYKN
tara:strand:- start:1016 stop:1414 length:399 start_codon:yes stop_codon:yes gene_type:complete